MVTKKKLIEYLQNRGNYEDIDELLIDELAFNQYVMKESKKDIKQRGINVPVNAEGTVLQLNHSIPAYNKAVGNILNISRKLGLSPYDRKQLNIDTSLDDGF